MCVTTIERSSMCNCEIHRHLICNDHKAHTHKQIDNEPCPKLQELWIETAEGGCGYSAYSDTGKLGTGKLGTGRLKCLEAQDEMWVFEDFDRRLHDFSFLEPKGDLYLMSPECLYAGNYTLRHECGMKNNGRTPFLHLNEYLCPIERKEVKQYIKAKLNAGSTQVEAALAKKKTGKVEQKRKEVEVNDEDVEMGS